MKTMMIEDYDDVHLPKYLIRIFNNKRYMLQFIATGQLYMNTLEFFRNMEEGFQGDHKEGKLIDESMHATLEVSSISDFRNPDIVLEDVECTINGYVYCFFAAGENDINVSEGKLYYNPKDPLNLKDAVLQYKKEDETQDIYIVVLDAKKAIQAIEQQFKTIEFVGYQGFVEYVQEESLPPRRIIEIISNRPWSIAFIKSQRYEYQKEWRVFIDTKPLDNHAELYIKNMDKIVLGAGCIPATEILK